MNALRVLSLTTLLSFVTLFVYVLPVSASSITNEIKINSNTGGNTINGESTDKSIKTGNSSTSVSIKNELTTSDATTSTTTLEKTDIKIGTFPYDEQIIRLSTSNNVFELTHRDGKGMIQITDENGQIQEAILENNETFTANFDQGKVEIQTSSDEFYLVFNQSPLITKLPLTVDSINSKLSATVGDQSFSINLTPDQAQTRIISENYLDQLTDTPMLIEADGQPHYLFEGYLNRKLLGIRPIQTNKTLLLNPDTGEVTTDRFDSFWDQFLYALSF